MQAFSITLTGSPDPADVEVVKQGLEAHDSSQGIFVDRVPLAMD